MATARTVAEKVGDWNIAFEAIKDTMTPAAFKGLMDLTLADPQDYAAMNLGVQLARIIFANDRAAAIVASTLTGTGVRSAPMGDSIVED